MKARDKIVKVLAEGPETELSGLEIKRRAGLWFVSTLYVNLFRLESEVRVESRWEPAFLSPRRRLYRLVHWT